jgi:hypothetical protein
MLCVMESKSFSPPSPLTQTQMPSSSVLLPRADVSLDKAEGKHWGRMDLLASAFSTCLRCRNDGLFASPLARTPAAKRVIKGVGKTAGRKSWPESPKGASHSARKARPLFSVRCNLERNGETCSQLPESSKGESRVA